MTVTLRFQTVSFFLSTLRSNFKTDLQRETPMRLFNFLTQEIAIDLGTANTVIIHNDKVVVDEPSIVAINRLTNKVVAVGKKAMQMHENTHDNLKTIRQFKDAV